MVTVPGSAPGRARDFRLRGAVIGGSGLLWLLACVLPALQLRTQPPGPDSGPWLGGGLLAIGPLGPRVLAPGLAARRETGVWLRALGIGGRG
ncbi:MAG TPA: hypothetical protein DHU96_24785, partial [Actinobacteria bacterium]|nr:hypothetical protein [Actinomycetota bacterium]